MCVYPIINALQDRLDKSSFILYLLERYKRRTEWFMKKDLCKRYKSVNKSYEQIFEDDLRLFLFDQGVDFPFSTPQSASGRADVVGQIETEDPIIVEVKIFDKNKGYGVDRIKDGFGQIVDYTTDYNKNTGYLVIYNMEETELDFNFSDSNNMFPPSISLNGKVFYFIVINLSIVSASKKGPLKKIPITETELINNT